MTSHVSKAVQLAFNYLRKTNRMLIVNDKDDNFFHSFFTKYKVCNISLLGSDFESIPYSRQRICCN